ncbi:hypothetical protein [Clostridium sp. OF09-36]
MTFTYPAVITPHKDDDGFHIVFPDLESARAMDQILRMLWTMHGRQLTTG